MGNKLLELKNINMVFKKKNAVFASERNFHVLKNVNLSIEEGEILALVGESGCGKTTIGKIITGLLKPTSGEVVFEGDSVYKLFSTGSESFKKSMQFVQQDSYAALNPVRTIYQSLSAAVKASGFKGNIEEKEKKIFKLLEDVGLTPPEQYLYKYPHQMSGGQRQRVLIARALALNPKIIVADEPVSMIDVSLRISILNLMLKLNKEKGISFVYITHDLATAKYIADEGRIAVMYLGEIVELSNLNEMITNPKHPYTQALISAVPVPDPKIAKNITEIPIKNMELMSLEHRKDGCSFRDRCLYASESCETEISYMEIGEALVKCNLKVPPTWKK